MSTPVGGDTGGPDFSVQKRRSETSAAQHLPPIAQQVQQATRQNPLSADLSVAGTRGSFRASSVASTGNRLPTSSEYANLVQGIGNCIHGVGNSVGAQAMFRPRGGNDLTTLRDGTGLTLRALLEEYEFAILRTTEGRNFVTPAVQRLLATAETTGASATVDFGDGTRVDFSSEEARESTRELSDEEVEAIDAFVETTVSDLLTGGPVRVEKEKEEKSEGFTDKGKIKEEEQLAAQRRAAEQTRDRTAQVKKFVEGHMQQPPQDFPQ